VEIGNNYGFKVNLICSLSRLSLNFFLVSKLLVLKWQKLTRFIPEIFSNSDMDLRT
jgi:hypothetical protein